MTWDLPKAVEIDGKEYKITNECDYRVVLDVIKVFKDNDLSDAEKVFCGLSIFYEDKEVLKDAKIGNEALKQMMIIINNGEEQTEEDNSPPIMDWEHDFNMLAPQINKVLGIEIRNPDKYLHWYTFVGGYYGIEPENNPWATIIGIRNKLRSGKKLEKWEEKFYRENKKRVDLPLNLTSEESEWLDSDW